jgi:hypothetical protein
MTIVHEKAAKKKDDIKKYLRAQLYLRSGDV